MNVCVSRNLSSNINDDTGKNLLSRDFYYDDINVYGKNVKDIYVYYCDRLLRNYSFSKDIDTFYDNFVKRGVTIRKFNGENLVVSSVCLFDEKSLVLSDTLNNVVSFINSYNGGRGDVPRILYRDNDMDNKYSIYTKKEINSVFNYVFDRMGFDLVVDSEFCKSVFIKTIVNYFQRRLSLDFDVNIDNVSIILYLLDSDENSVKNTVGISSVEKFDLVCINPGGIPVFNKNVSVYDDIGIFVRRYSFLRDKYCDDSWSGGLRNGMILCTKFCEHIL